MARKKNKKRKRKRSKREDGSPSPIGRLHSSPAPSRASLSRDEGGGGGGGDQWAAHSTRPRDASSSSPRTPLVGSSMDTVQDLFENRWALGVCGADGCDCTRWRSRGISDAQDRLSDTCVGCDHSCLQHRITPCSKQTREGPPSSSSEPWGRSVPRGGGGGLSGILASLQREQTERAVGMQRFIQEDEHHRGAIAMQRKRRKQMKKRCVSV